MSDDKRVTIRRALVLLFVALLCFAQAPAPKAPKAAPPAPTAAPPAPTAAPSEDAWKTSATLPGVDLTSLSQTQKRAVLAALRSETCTCGCEMKIAECRMKDPNCPLSRRLADFAVQAASNGKPAAQVLADLRKYAATPPPVLDPPRKLAIDGDPFRGPADAKVTIVEFSDFQCPLLRESDYRGV